MLFHLRPCAGAAVLAIVSLALSACGGGGEPGDKPAAGANNATQPAQIRPLDVASIPLLPNGSTSTRVEVPISVHRTSQGDTFMTVPITVGNTTMSAILDTGSPGLRLLPGDVQSNDYVATVTPSSIEYDGGDKVQGVTARGVVRIGGASTNEPINFTLIQQVACTAAKPNCNARNGTVPGYGFLQETPSSGPAFHGYKAILGVSLRGDTVGSDGVYSPLAQIGRSTFIVRITNENGPGTGRLIINPDAQDDTGWAPFRTADSTGNLPNGLPAWPDQTLQGCLDNRSNGERHCGYVMLDSGAPRVTALSGAIPVPTAYPNGHVMHLSLYQDQQHALTSAPFAIRYQDPSIGNAAMVHLLPTSLPNHMIWGTMAFRQFDVMYSQAGGFVALRGH